MSHGNVTFGSEVSWPLTGDMSQLLDAQNFHTEKSIISEHYGFTPALLDDEDVCLFCDRKLRTPNYKPEMGVACVSCFKND